MTSHDLGIVLALGAERKGVLAADETVATLTRRATHYGWIPLTRAGAPAAR